MSSRGSLPPRVRSATSKIDSGFNAIKAAAQTGPDYRINARFKPRTGSGELKRIRLSTLLAWIRIAKEEHEIPDTFDSGESIFDTPAVGAPSPVKKVHRAPSILSMAETEATAVSGPVPRLFLPASYYPTHPEDGTVVRPTVPLGTKTAVLLDLRDPEEADKLALWGTYPYHHSNLNKSVNYFDNDLYGFFKREGNLTVLIGDANTPLDEVGARLGQKGVTNLICLRQEFIEAACAAPDLLIGETASTFDASQTIQTRARQASARARRSGK